MRKLLFLVAFAACHPALPPIQPVAIVAWPSQAKPTCPTISLPEPVQIAGWPDMERQQIFVTRVDMENLIKYEQGVHDYLELVQQCMARLTNP
jgi:hypothetical protein|nr:hypothetical protein [Kofleriaceae bacterium]